MLVIFEGAPATGKTTIAHRLEFHGALRIAEVSERFVRPTPESQNWYLERQLDRWAEAQNCAGLVIIDGDILQPIWYNWMFPERISYTWKHSISFFRSHIDQLGVPDLYIYWWIDEHERHKREHMRSKEQGHSVIKTNVKIEKYRNMHKIQRAYFEALAGAFPNFIQVNSTLDFNSTELLELKPNEKKPNISEVLDFIEIWLKKHDPKSFVIN